MTGGKKREIEDLKNLKKIPSEGNLRECTLEEHDVHEKQRKKFEKQEEKKRKIEKLREELKSISNQSNPGGSSTIPLDLLPAGRYRSDSSLPSRVRHHNSDKLTLPLHIEDRAFENEDQENYCDCSNPGIWLSNYSDC